VKPTLEEVQAGVINVVGEIARTQAHADDEITLETKLGADLGFSSMDIIHLMASIDMRFQCKLKYDLFFRRADQFVEDFSVTEIADFVFNNFDNQVSGPAAM
jgi:acyl carrier protein